MSNTLRPYGLQHARLPCPSPSPGVCSNSRPLSWWYRQTISSSFVPFSSFLQSFPASGSFPMSWLFASGGQSFGTSASESVPPMNVQDWFPLGGGWLSQLTSPASYILNPKTAIKQLNSWSFLLYEEFSFPVFLHLSDSWPLCLYFYSQYPRVLGFYSCLAINILFILGPLKPVLSRTWIFHLVIKYHLS